LLISNRGILTGKVVSRFAKPFPDWESRLLIGKTVSRSAKPFPDWEMTL
jgi:hypothetical protein